MNDDRIMTIDPAHFHAALIHKEMLPGISPTVHVYAPLGPDLNAHLDRMARFNQRAQQPTAWKVDVDAGPGFLERALRNPRGNIAVLAGRNHQKIDTMLACVEAGLHVLADKPWIIKHEHFPKLERLLTSAAERKVIVCDIMTERHEITSILQRELVRDSEIFGNLVTGSENEPAVRMESVHALKKLVAGTPLRRPREFFDIHRQGEGLADVGTHLVDLVNWMIAPGQAIDHQRDIQILAAGRWPTKLTREDYQQISGESDFPAEFAGSIGGDSFDYCCNNSVSYMVRRHHVGLDIRWDVELPAGDTHNAIFGGTRADVAIRQSPHRPGPPELYVLPHDDAAVEALRDKVASWSTTWPGLDVVAECNAFQILIPEVLRIGHEAHFAQVTSEFLAYVRGQRPVPDWEGPNLLAKYFVTTSGVELARRLSASRV